MFVQMTGRGNRHLRTSEPKDNNMVTMFVQMTGRGNRHLRTTGQSMSRSRKLINTICPSCKGECLDYSMYVCTTCQNKGYIFHPENLFGDNVCPSCKGACLNANMMYCPTCRNKGYIAPKPSDLLKKRLGCSEFNIPKETVTYRC